MNSFQMVEKLETLCEILDESHPLIRVVAQIAAYEDQSRGYINDLLLSDGNPSNINTGWSNYKRWLDDVRNDLREFQHDQIILDTANLRQRVKQYEHEINLSENNQVESIYTQLDDFNRAYTAILREYSDGAIIALIKNASDLQKTIRDTVSTSSMIHGNLADINEYVEPFSFFDVARSLNLDGPTDWSEKIDEYLDGKVAISDE